MTLLMNSLGIKAEWRVIQGRPDFFNITKKMHNALQGADINLRDQDEHLRRGELRKRRAEPYRPRYGLGARPATGGLD